MSATQASPRRVIGAVVATSILSFCGVIVETAMNITFPALMSHFGIVTSSLQWMTTLYLLVVVSITPLSEAAVEFNIQYPNHVVQTRESRAPRASIPNKQAK